jgi:hypothetical protein
LTLTHVVESIFDLAFRSDPAHPDVHLISSAGTLLVALASAACIAAFSLLIGMLAKSEEQAVIFSLIPP